LSREISLLFCRHRIQGLDASCVVFSTVSIHFLYIKDSCLKYHRGPLVALPGRDIILLYLQYGNGIENYQRGVTRNVQVVY
jgi:hypothetical protein